jgi:hypothetical protein
MIYTFYVKNFVSHYLLNFRSSLKIRVETLPLSKLNAQQFLARDAPTVQLGRRQCNHYSNYVRTSSSRLLFVRKQCR